MSDSQLLDTVHRCLGSVIERYGFQPPDTQLAGPMGAAAVYFENSEFTISVTRERGGETAHICVGAKRRARPRAHLRSYAMGQLRPFFEDQPDWFQFETLEAEASWLTEHADRVLDSDVINSEDLRSWAVRASRR